MLQVSDITRHVERAGAVVNHQVRLIHEGLHQLAALTVTLLQDAAAPERDVDEWIAREFVVDPDGYFDRRDVLARARRGDLDARQFILYVHERFKDDPEVRRRLYRFRHLGPRLQGLRDRLGGLEWFCYQDRAGWALSFPMHDPSKAIPADFDWLNYLTFRAVEPGVNPRREIRSPPPNIDYGGKGLMITPSVPVYLDDGAFVGVWSIDVPVRRLLQDVRLSLDVEGQSTFLIERNGKLIAHERLSRRVGEAKGNYSREDLCVLGGDFARRSPAELFASTSGVQELDGPDGERLVVAHCALEALDWLVVSTVPARELLESTRRSFHEAFSQLGRGDLSYRIDAASSNELRVLVDGYNEMVERLSRTLEERSQEQRNRWQSQRLQAIGQLSSRVAHDFNNILTVILQSLTLLELEGGAPSEHHDAIRVCAERAAALTTQLLAFSKQGPVELEPINLGAFCAKHLPLLKRLLPERLELSLDAGKTAPVMLDRTHALQILLNLVVNARDALLGPGSIRLAVAQKGERVELTVSDDGAGIPLEIQQKVFEPFFTTKSRGTGLGLSTVREIVRTAGGEVSLRSAPGEGTTVTIDLPPGAGTPELEPPAQGSTNLGGLRILVVDDEPLLRETTGRMLTRMGASVVTAETGEAALGRLSGETFDLLLSDVVMPLMSGSALLSRVRALSPDLPVLFMSGYTDDEFLLREVGKQSILRKPFTAGDLAEAIERLRARALA